MTEQRVSVLGTYIHPTTWQAAEQRILAWASTRESRYVCVCNVHSVVTARLDPDLSDAINAADLVTPDGMPIAWVMRRKGFPHQPRIDGPDLMWRLCSRAQDLALPVYLLGGTPQVLDQLQRRLQDTFPQLQIAGNYSPPFRPLNEFEQQELVTRVNASGAALLFVGLGCPKQEVWMFRQVQSLRCVALGVGAAFDFHAGAVARAPTWMRNHGLEWAFRLLSEPRRLWRRYLVTNSLFLYFGFRDWILPPKL